MLLALSTLGALYCWPDLRPVAARLLSWFAGLFLALFALTVLCAVVADVEALQKRSPLYTAAHAGNFPRVVELLQYPHVRSDIDVGMRGGGAAEVGRQPKHSLHGIPRHALVGHAAVRCRPGWPHLREGVEDVECRAL